MVKKKVAKKSVVKPAKKGVAKGKTITKEIAQRYLKDHYAVELSTFTVLDDAAAQLLSKSDNYLSLNGLKDLSEGAAKSLAHFKGVLELNGLTDVSDAVAQSLVKVGSGLALNGLTSLPEGLARAMASHSGWNLELNGVTSMSDKAAKLLSKRKGLLALNGLTSLTEGLARAMALHSGWLNLNGVTSMSDEAAKLLSTRKKNCELELCGVKSVSDTAAKWLASYKGNLKLGVAALSDASAKAFASFAKKLKLPNICTLSEAAAKSLKKLDADGRLEVSDRFCKTMKQLKDHCDHWYGLLQYRGWKLDVKKMKWKDVPDKAWDVLRGAFEYPINLDEIEITRLILTSPIGGQRYEYFVGFSTIPEMDISWTYVVNDKAVVAELES